MRHRLRPLTALIASGFAAAAPALGQTSSGLAPHFGFEEPRVVVVDQNCGPAVVADIDADGLNDLIVVNNAKSRIEVHAQRRTPRSDEDIMRDLDANELPPSRYYDRTEISVAHRVTAIEVFDVDRDGKPDIVYAGSPAEIVILRQTDRLTFEVMDRRRVRNLASPQGGFTIADVRGDGAPELLAAVGGKINIFELTPSGVIGEPIVLGSGQDIYYFFVEDFNGDGRKDIMAAIPDDDAPLRLWLQDGTASGLTKQGEPGPELRFEMPQLREAEPIRFPDRAAASIAVIERASRRLVLSDLATEQIDTSTNTSGREEEAGAEIHAFPGGPEKDRSVVVADIDADGLLDLLVSESQLNSLGLYLQERGLGLGSRHRFSALKDPKVVAAGQWDDDAPLEVFVLSESDKAVGVSNYDAKADRLSFPQPIPIATQGASPVAMAFTPLRDGPALSIVVRKRRNHTLEIHRASGADPVTIELEDVNRPPSSIIPGDFDRDGYTDLALLTPNEPLVLVRHVGGSAEDVTVLTDKDMPQFGLVQAAGPDNTALLDMDGDGYDELLIADENFVRACAFSSDRGWRVVDQITMPEASSALTSLSVLHEPGSAPAIVAFDRGNARLVIMRRDDSGAWSVSQRLELPAFDVSQLFAGAFSGDGQPNVLGVSDAAFGVIRLAGRRVSLREFAAYRSDEEKRVEHEIETGDLNSDGYVDLVVLDAGEQMCEIFTLSASRRLLLATEFKVFESRLFSGGESRQFEPRSAIIADVTGDGADDLILEVHDRYLIYPQMTAPH